MERFRATVVWFSSIRGYGFLNAGDESDIFCHFSAIQDEDYKTLKDGDAVEFSIVPGVNGKPQAENVVVF